MHPFILGPDKVSFKLGKNLAVGGELLRGQSALPDRTRARHGFS